MVTSKDNEDTQFFRTSFHGTSFRLVQEVRERWFEVMWGNDGLYRQNRDASQTRDVISK